VADIPDSCSLQFLGWNIAAPDFLAALGILGSSPGQQDSFENSIYFYGGN
jgi:hypothetical protein